jgi:hypothetical protein
VKNTLSIAALVLVALVSSAQTAHAGLIDWMQEWSGPGPFGSKVPGALVTACPGLFQVDSVAEQNKRCYFFDTRRLVASDNDNFPVKVVTFFVDVGVTYRIRRAVTLGVGAGFMTADGKESAARPTITAPRATFEPVTLAAQLFRVKEQTLSLDNNFWRRLVHVPKIYMRGNFILGQLNGKDLGVNKSKYDRTNEYVISRGLILDFGELILHQ